MKEDCPAKVGREQWVFVRANEAQRRSLSISPLCCTLSASLSFAFDEFFFFYE